MWVPFWALIYVVSSVPQTAVLQQNVQFPTQAECQEHIKSVASRMPDYFRGVLKAPLDFVIQVHGECQIPGRPA